MKCFEINKKKVKSKLKTTKLMTVTLSEVIKQNNKMMEKHLRKVRI